MVVDDEKDSTCGGETCLGECSGTTGKNEGKKLRASDGDEDGRLTLGCWWGNC